MEPPTSPQTSGNVVIDESTNNEKFLALKSKLIELFNFKDDIQSIEITSSDHSVNIHLKAPVVEPLYELKCSNIDSVEYCNEINIVVTNFKIERTILVKSAKIALIDFAFPVINEIDINSLSNQQDCMAVDRLLLESRRETLNITKTFKSMGCGMVISSKVNDHKVSKFLDKLGIIYLEGIKLNDLKLLETLLNGEIIDDFQSLRDYKFGYAGQVETLPETKTIQISNIPDIRNIYNEIGKLFREDNDQLLEITTQVVSYLTLKELFRLSLTCKNMFHKFLNEETLKNLNLYHVSLIQENIWKPHALLYFPRFQKDLNVKNWFIVMKRRIALTKKRNNLPIFREKLEGGSKIPKPSFSIRKGEQFIENCEWVFECPLSYHELQETEHKNQKYCNVCNKHVYKADRMTSFKSHVQEGHCVAYPISESRGVTMGFFHYNDYRQEGEE